MNLSLFDLDNTLLADDSDYLWGVFLIDKGVVDKQVYQQKNDQFYAQYINGTLDIFEYQKFMLKPLTQIPLDKILALREEFINTRIRPKIAPKAPALIAQRRAAGDTLVIITATNRFVTEPIAQLLDIPHLLATEPEIIDGQYTGRVAGEPCFQDGKITRLKQWLAKQEEPTGTIRFYSDSHNDIPLLRFADTAIAVHPDAQLEATAKQEGWEIMSLMESVC